jgi:GT2 family glycosyltransferase
MRKDFSRVAVLILNYNGKCYLRRCLDTVLSQSLTYGGYDVYLIDNASVDGSVEYVRENYPSVKIIQNKMNLGFAGGFNIAIEKVIDKYDYLVILNNDVIVEENWLEELILPFKRDPKIGICTSLVLFPDGELIDHAGGYVLNLAFGVVGGFMGRKSIRTIRFTSYFPVFYASGCAMAVSTTLLKKIGCFDPTYFMYYEDVDLSWRAQLAGYKVVCNPNAVLYHLGSGREKKLEGSLEYHKEKNLLSTFFANLSFVNLIMFFPLLVSCRLLIVSLIYLRESKICFRARLRGIAYFIKNARYNLEKRKITQKLRRVPDRVVFSSNPTPLFSLRLFIQEFKKFKHSN